MSGPILGDAPSLRESPAPARDAYRGWSIDLNYIGEWTATGPDYDASYEGEEDGWVDNGQKVDAPTLEALHAEIDTFIEEHGE